MAFDSELPSSEDFARIEEHLVRRVAVRHRRQVLRHRLIAAAAVLVVAGAGVAAGTIANPTQQSKFAYCYGGSTTGSRLAQLILPNSKNADAGARPTASPERVANAVILCKSAWSVGFFNTSSKTGPFPVPKLQVCLRDDLIISVFRKPATGGSARDFCNELGLSAP